MPVAIIMSIMAETADMITVRNIIARETDRKKEADTHETQGSVL
jgi:hypothetical protein